MWAVHVSATVDECNLIDGQMQSLKPGDGVDHDSVGEGIECDDKFCSVRSGTDHIEVVPCEDTILPLDRLLALRGTFPVSTLVILLCFSHAT